tara:strand:+ start:1330 stop:1449 length:120 start_codon:yes stop_codon:yes gene_type:complete
LSKNEVTYFGFPLIVDNKATRIRRYARVIRRDVMVVRYA